MCFMFRLYYRKKICNKMNKDKKYLSQEVKDAFIEYDWPGNIRELENVLEHGICFATGDKIMLKDLPEYFFWTIDYQEYWKRGL